ncbi:S8 family serine peptidase [Gemmatimonas sp.]
MFLPASIAGLLLVTACKDASSPTQPAVAAPAFTQSAAQDRPVYIVTFKDAARDIPGLARQLAAGDGSTPRFVYEHALRGFAAPFSPQAAQALLRNPNVASVEQDQVITADATQSPATWGLDRIDQNNLPLNSGYSYTTTGAGVTAYIIDTGILPSHNEFGGRVSSIGFTAIIDGRGTTDCNGHGTHVAGTVGGTTYGVAKSVALVAVRVLGCTGSGSTSGVIAGVDWVTSNPARPAVANMSLGGSASSTLDNAVANAVIAGVTFVVAAGNSSVDACNSSPARAAAALTVGATTSSDARATYSNFGTCLDIFAPGSSITSAWSTSNTATNTISGTSMASPHVAGVAALYLQGNTTASPATVAAALVTNATANVVTTPGTGSPNRLLYSGFIGGGVTPPPATSIVLAVRTSVKGKNTIASLSWTGSVGTATIYRGSTAVGTSTSGSYSDNPGRSPGTATYQVCVGTLCSNAVTVSY